jgi:Flp pilus assembly pilin Flp
MNSPAKSKINYAQIAGLISTALVYYGVELSPEQLISAVVGIQSAQSILTVIFRTFYTGAKAV